MSFNIKIKQRMISLLLCLLGTLLSPFFFFLLSLKEFLFLPFIHTCHHLLLQSQMFLVFFFVLFVLLVLLYFDSSLSFLFLSSWLALEVFFLLPSREIHDRSVLSDHIPATFIHYLFDNGCFQLHWFLFFFDLYIGLTIFVDSEATQWIRNNFNIPIYLFPHIFESDLIF